MRLSFRSKLVLSHVGLVVASMLLVGVVLDRSLERQLGSQLDERLSGQAATAADWVAAGKHPDKLAVRLARLTGAQVAIRDAGGRVVGSVGSTASGGEAGHAVSVRAGKGTLELSAPPELVTTPLAELRRNVALVLLLGVVAAIGLALLASRLAARPLRAMRGAAARIAEGDYAIMLPAATPDDFGALSDSLGSLARQLDERMRRIGRLESMRRELVADVSHELQTPVTAIQGYSETLLRGGSDAETSQRFLSIMHRQATRLGLLVGRLLELSAIEARGPDESLRERVDVGAVAEEVAQTLRARAAEREITVAVERGRETLALCDPLGIERVLENLVDNAIKYGKRGGRVTIAIGSSGASVRVKVSDDGAGIEPEHLPRVFERFYRSARTTSGEGVGLGLAIAKHLVESMGGSVRAESTPGAGAAFTVELAPAPNATA